MAGSSPTPQGTTKQASWPRDLHRAAVILAASGGFYWLSYAFQGMTWWVPSFGLIYVDLLLAWFAVLLNVATWPDLWTGLRDLRASRAGAEGVVLPWRAFLLTLLLVLVGIVVLPLRYHTVASTEAWILILYVSAFPFLGWTFVPILALHGILFGRVGNFLRLRFRVIVDLGAAILFAVAAATTVIVLQNPEPLIFFHAWTVGEGLMPAAAALGYVLVAFGLTPQAVADVEPAPKPRPTRGWALAKTPGVRLTAEHAAYQR